MAKKNTATSGKSWQGRLTADLDAATAKLVASIDVDHVLWKYDIAGSLVHARMLQRQGVLTQRELASIRKGLLAVAGELEAGTLALPIELEDIHMVIEKALIERVGSVGGKLHTGRSRNDQVALDLRLWARDAVDRLAGLVGDLQRAFLGLARCQGEVIMPAYTHLQRAQPILAGAALLAYVEMLQRDVTRLADARKRINVCPLGSGAVAGTSLPLDRQFVAAELGFDDVTRNSIDATSDRDFLAELCFACSLLGVHLSRWAEDWIIYSTTEFGAVVLHDAYCTSSSMMPQKKNADTLELIRGKSATAIAQLTGLLTLLKGLPLAYNRDLQDDKRLTFACVDAVEQALGVACGIVSTARFNEPRIAATLEGGFLDATSLAEYITARGLPFRQAHHVVGRLVAQAEKQGKTLAELDLPTLRAACEQIGSDVYDYLGAANVVGRYRTEGAAGPEQLKRQMAFWEKKLG
ncbi:MAG TPA: argininosuccinate lyase [Phycisphaerae bacterium]|nr:argininosuccinate lyase [Phycisphaerae bacterium]